MSKRHIRNLMTGGGSLLVALAFTGTVSAQAASQTFQANLTQLNNSGTTGTATVRLEGNRATVTVNTTGASANLATPPTSASAVRPAARPTKAPTPVTPRNHSAMSVSP